ncbi:MATE family efflux transporter [Winogradskyella sp.]|uniref:lipopolysaccharide biosynthesis protein n=1 Tax=Winogradskyella sp. TaxID=1883156 RepID=UPI0025E4581F|nr:MATE family efflux transporter [Winogradskyella sp.]
MNKILSLFGINSGRDLNIVNHIGLSFFYKIGSIVSNLALVPLSLTYLNTEGYGVWLTLSSFLSWFTLFDVGLGHGLRNKLAEANAQKNYSLAQVYVSSAYFTIMGISLLVLFLFIIINFFLDWGLIFNVEGMLKNDIAPLMILVFTFFSIQLIVKLISSIHLAEQNHSFQSKVQFITSLLSLICIWILLKTTDGSLLLFGTIFSALPVVVMLVYNLISFTNKYKHLRPQLKLWSSKHVKEILSLGTKFFIIQISVIVLFSTDNIIITNLFSPEEVVPYNIALKYFSQILIFFSIVIAPYWSTITEAFVKSDYSWIKKSMKAIFRIWLLVIPILLIIMLIIADWVYKIWVGDNVVIMFSLNISMALFVLIQTFQLIYTNFINGVGRIKLQMIVGIIALLINIPLSILFAKELNLGTTGVILATCVSIGLYAIYKPIQYYLIINKKAKGIWNK